MDVIEKLNRLRLERNLSVYRLAELSGINQSTLANTFSRRTVPSIANLEIMCETMGITLSQFFADGEQTLTLNKQEMELLSAYRKLDKNTQSAITQLVKTISDSRNQ